MANITAGAFTTRPEIDGTFGVCTTTHWIATAVGMSIDINTRRPRLANVTGGLSGPAIKPIAVRCVYQVHDALPDVPILGMGGIRTGLDALEFVLAGASAVSVGKRL